MVCGQFTFFVLCVFTSVLAANGHKKVIKLTEDNWTDMLEGQWVVEFFAPWCPACKALEKTWLEFASWSEEYGMKVAQVDVTKSPGLSGRFMVTALPTIFHVLNGEFRQYKGSRDLESFQSFMESEKWKQVEPVSSWMSPQSMQMSVVSAFFKLSQILRHVHSKLMEDYGLPSWGSYIIFAVATILMGALLGLMLVCFIDMVCPPKSPSKSSKYAAKDRKDKISDDEMDFDDDDIKDDLMDVDHDELAAEDAEGELSQSDNNGSDKDDDEGHSQSDSDVVKLPNSNPNSPRVTKRRARKE